MGENETGLEELKANLKELLKDKEIAEAAKELEAKLPESIRSGGKNSHVNDLKKRGYGSSFREVSDLDGADMALGKIDALIEEAEEDLELAKREIAQESIEGFEPESSKEKSLFDNTHSIDESNDNDEGDDDNDDNGSDGSDGSGVSTETIKPRASAPSPSPPPSPSNSTIQDQNGDIYYPLDLEFEGLTNLVEYLNNFF